MKKLYIPKGETLELSHLHTELIVVKGTLKVHSKLTAKSIQGDGVIEAAEIICDTIVADTVIAEITTAEKIAVKKLLVQDCRASEILATDFIESLMVQANRISMTLSSIEVCEADEIINLPQKKRGMIGMLLVSWWRSLLLPLKISAKAEKKTKASKRKESRQSTVLNDDLISALITELEKRGFQREQPDAKYQQISFVQEEVA